MKRLYKGIPKQFYDTVFNVPLGFIFWLDKCTWIYLGDRFLATNDKNPYSIYCEVFVVGYSDVVECEIPITEVEITTNGEIVRLFAPIEFEFRTSEIGGKVDIWDIADDIGKQVQRALRLTSFTVKIDIDNDGIHLIKKASETGKNEG